MLISLFESGREEIAEFSKLEPLGPFRYDVSHCVAPLVAPTEVRLLREFVEFHSRQGIGHFRFYDGGFADASFRAHFKEAIVLDEVEVIPFKAVYKFDQDGEGEVAR